MPSLLTLAPYTDDGLLRVVVETPRASALKLEFDPKTDAITVSRQLAMGLSYPYDWGFVPGTRAEDGDPLDAMVVHSRRTYPGMVLPCRLLGMVVIQQRMDDAEWITNNRLLAAPGWDGALPGPESVSQLSKEMIRELEQFFMDTAFFTGKRLRLRGWKGPRAAHKLIRQLRAGA